MYFVLREYGILANGQEMHMNRVHTHNEVQADTLSLDTVVPSFVHEANGYVVARCTA